MYIDSPIDLYIDSPIDLYIDSHTDSRGPYLVITCLLALDMEQSFGQPPVPSKEPALKNSTTAADVLLSPWDGPYGGTPPWRSVRPENFESAFSTAMEMENRDLDEISSNCSTAFIC